LGLGQWAALLNLNAPRGISAAIVVLNLVGEVFDDLSVADEQKVVVHRHDGRDFGEESSYVLVTVTLAGRVFFGRRTPRGAMPAGDLGVDPFAGRYPIGTPPHDGGRSGRDPHAGGLWSCHCAPRRIAPARAHNRRLRGSIDPFRLPA
jgi:hypothetical protein